MNFLDAHAALRAFSGGPPLRVSLLSSAVTATLELYLKATAASFGFEAQIDSIGFDEMALKIRSTSCARRATARLATRSPRQPSRATTAPVATGPPD